MITRISLANEIDEYDQQIADMNSGKKDCFDAYRQQLIDNGMEKAAIKAEIEAVKAAIKRRRAAAKDEAALEEKDALVDEIFAEITRRSVRGAHAREIVEKFDAETGEVFDARSPRNAAEAVSERTGNNPRMAEQAEPEAAAEAAGNDLREPVAAGQGQIIREGDAPRETDRLGGDASGPDTEFSPASHGEAEAHSGAMEVPQVRGAANAGGDHVDPDHSHAATAGTRINHIVPATPGITFEECPPKPMKRLPFAHCFPELTKSEYDQLSALIEERGVEEPIIRNGDTIIDGWNRYAIARSRGIAYPVKQFEGGDILSFVIAAQRSARDWLPSQERKIAAALCKELPHRANDIMAAFHIEEEFA